METLYKGQKTIKKIWIIPQYREVRNTHSTLSELVVRFLDSKLEAF